ncbi:MAG: molybdate ABC transporter substrate-binding protein [Actinomycetota bacterium]|nr:molybdate ABC transporter substrate-binding protein [Actinomycetota bacterium]
MTRAAAAVAGALLLAACGDAPPSTLTVLAAASLADAFADHPAGMPVRYSFAGSQQLVAQVEGGVPADVVATADEVTMDRLVRAGLVETPRVLARNRLAIAVRPGNPRRITALADLAAPAIRVALADESVPAGRYARTVLDRAGVEVRPVSFELDVKAVVTRVASGEADAGIVYATDVRPGAGVEGVPLPDEANVLVSYAVAVIRSSRDLANARTFVDRLLDGPGRQALVARGYLAP